MTNGDRNRRDACFGVAPQSLPPLSGEPPLMRPPREGVRKLTEPPRVERVSGSMGRAAVGAGDMRKGASMRGLWMLSGDPRPPSKSAAGDAAAGEHSSACEHGEHRGGGAPCGEGGVMPCSVGEVVGIGTWLGLGLGSGLGLKLWLGLRLGLRLGL